MQKRGLGKGLQALIPGDALLKSDGEQIKRVPVDKIEPNPNQPRRIFDEVKMQELAASIQQHGVVQPIVLRPLGEGHYELVAGERRWRACRQLKIETIPAVVKDFSRREVTEIALIENIQRDDLTPMEEAQAYRTLLELFGLTQEELALRVGKSRPFISNALRLLTLPEEVQEAVSRNVLSAGHARALLALDDPGLIKSTAANVVEGSLSVRSTEELVKRVLSPRQNTRKKPLQRKQWIQNEIIALEEDLQTTLGTRVRIKPHEKGGHIEIEYYSDEDLTRIAEAIAGRES